MKGSAVSIFPPSFSLIFLDYEMMKVSAISGDEEKNINHRARRDHRYTFRQGWERRPLFALHPGPEPLAIYASAFSATSAVRFF
ncbi:MAG: hypothetical protein AMJ94_08465 [Deltaproteobacteria bacterium SM23_61]|nr:MAG: hypothetical protein AMJ94_08465 [Deltaproteobacteria bacterium SM23_61]